MGRGAAAVHISGVYATLGIWSSYLSDGALAVLLSGSTSVGHIFVLEGSNAGGHQLQLRLDNEQERSPVVAYRLLIGFSCSASERATSKKRYPELRRTGWSSPLKSPRSWVSTAPAHEVV